MDHTLHRFVGESAALASAASWALAIMLWHKIGTKASSYSMNMAKSIIGSLYLLIVVWLYGIAPIKASSCTLLALSGLIGIALGDTLFFMSLMNLGPRLSSLLGTLVPICVTILSFFVLHERLSITSYAGIFLTVSGVAWVFAERIKKTGIVRNRPLGIKYGLLSIICASTGIILSKIAVVSVPTVQATFIRMVSASAGLVLWGLLSRRLKEWATPFKDMRFLRSASLVVFISVFGGFWLFLVAVKYTHASIASALNETAPLFIMPMAFLFLKERISARAVLGALISIIGIILLFR